MGCALANFYDENGKYDAGKSRLYQILISEAAYQIWLIRCKRVINNENNERKWPSTQHIRLKLEKQINIRIKMDCIHTNEYKFNKKTLNKNSVKNTWRGLLENENRLPNNWTSKPGVLVGIQLSQVTEE